MGRRAGRGIGLLFALGSVAWGQDARFVADVGGGMPDGAFAIVATSDGGFVSAGFSESFSPGSFKALYLVKIDAGGQTVWTRTYEYSTGQTIGAAIAELPDGRLAIAGRTGFEGDFDMFLLVTDAQGNEIWHRVYNAGFDDRAHGLALTSDGGFVLAGQAWFPNGAFGNYDLHIVKVNETGVVQWRTSFEYDDTVAPGQDTAFAVIEVSDGGLAIAGYTQSSIWDGWLIRTDALGNRLWDRTYASAFNSDILTGIKELDDGGFILSGEMEVDWGDTDAALIRTDSLGNRIWTRVFGGRGNGQVGQGVDVLPDGGFVLTGMSATQQTSWNVGIWRTDANGNLVWSAIDGGTSDDRGWGVAVGAEAIVVAGWAWSSGSGFGDAHFVAYGDPALGCEADLTGDGIADSNDFFAYLDLFAAQDGDADITGNGVIDGDDFFAYLDLFAQGC